VIWFGPGWSWTLKLPWLQWRTTRLPCPFISLILFNMKQLPSQYECLKMIRKPCARPGQVIKVKTKFSRKQKWGKNYD
jgi:hypothetical protein